MDTLDLNELDQIAQDKHVDLQQAQPKDKIVVSIPQDEDLQLKQPEDKKTEEDFKASEKVHVVSSATADN